MNKWNLEKTLLSFFVSDQWMILRKNNTNIFYFWYTNFLRKYNTNILVFSDTFWYLLFLIDKSHLKEIILIFFVFSNTF